MALKVKKAEVEAEVKEALQNTEEAPDVAKVHPSGGESAIGVSASLNEDEVEAIQSAEQNDMEESADTRRLQLATNVVSKQFNLDPSYSLSKFDDKGKVVKLTLENKEFIIDVTIKDSDRHGMYVED